MHPSTAVVRLLQVWKRNEHGKRQKQQQQQQQQQKQEH